MRRWDLIVDGTVMEVDFQLRAGAIANGLQLQDEGYVAQLLRYFQLPLRRFPAVAFLGCCGTPKPPRGAAPLARATGAAGGGASPAVRGAKKVCFSKACVYRVLPTQQAAAAACAAGNASGAAAAGAADSGATTLVQAATSARVQAALSSATPLYGK